MDSEQRVKETAFDDGRMASELLSIAMSAEADEPELIDGDGFRALRQASEHFRMRAKLEGVPNPILGPRVHPDANVDMRYTLVEAGVSELVRIFREVTPQGRELSLALTNLEQAGLWALAGIGRDKSSGGTG